MLKNNRLYIFVLAGAVFGLTACGSSKTTLSVASQQPTSENVLDEVTQIQAQDDSGNSNILKSQLGSGLNGYDKDSIVTITFLDNFDSKPSDAWDVSMNNDGSVMAWVVSTGKTAEDYGFVDVEEHDDVFYDLYIAGDGGVSANEDSGFLFSGFHYLTSIEFNECFDTSGTNTMHDIFREDYNIKFLDISYFDTSNVTDMSGMFDMCTRLETVVIEDMDTFNVVDMSYMFDYCLSLQEIDVSNFDTSNVADMGHMFTCCTQIREIDVSEFNTSRVTKMNDMFQGCSAIEYIDVSGFNTVNVTDMSKMFENCENLTTLDVSKFDISNVTDMSQMFCGCSSLADLKMGTWDLTNVTTSNMFAETQWE